MSSCPDRRNVGTEHEEELRNSQWLREWNLDGTRANSAHIGWIPKTLEYLFRYVLDMANVAYQFWLPQRHKVILWLLAHLVM